MTPKKIVIISAAHPFKGGIAASSERLAIELKKMGHTVTVVTFTSQYPSFLFPGESQFSGDKAPDINIHRWIHAYNPLNWPIAARKIKALNADIIVCRFWMTLMGPCFGTIIRLIKSKKNTILSILDNIIPHEHRPGDKLFTHYFAKSIDKFIYMSKQVGEDLKTFNPNGKPSAFIPLPIFDNYGASVSKVESINYLKLDPDKKYALFFGIIRDYKGLDILLEAIGLLKNKLPDVRFIIAGEYYADSAIYEKLIDQLGIRDRLILHTRFIKNEDVKYYFCASDLIVQPYKSATQSGIAQIALHFIKPVIVTKVGGLHEIVDEGKTGYVAWPDSNSIAAAIVKHFESANTDQMESFIAKQRIKYSWDHLATEVLNS